MKKLELKRFVAVSLAAITVAVSAATPQVALADEVKTVDISDETGTPVADSGSEIMRDAHPVILGQSYDVELTGDNCDKHYFTFTTTDRNSLYKLVLEYIGGNTEKAVQLVLSDEDGTEMQRLLLRESEQKVNLSDLNLKSNTRYYLNIVNAIDDMWYNPNWTVLHDGEQEKFSFHVSELATVPNKLSVTAKASGKKAVKVSWSRSDEADKYVVAFRKKGAKNWVESEVSTDNTKANISGLKKNTKYQFRVRGIRVIDGNDYPGTWSGTKTVKTKK